MAPADDPAVLAVKLDMLGDSVAELKRDLREGQAHTEARLQGIQVSMQASLDRLEFVSQDVYKRDRAETDRRIGTVEQGLVDLRTSMRTWVTWSIGTLVVAAGFVVALVHGLSR